MHFCNAFINFNKICKKRSFIGGVDSDAVLVTGDARKNYESKLIVDGSNGVGVNSICAIKSTISEDRL